MLRDLSLLRIPVKFLDDTLSVEFYDYKYEELVTIKDCLVKIKEYNSITFNFFPKVNVGDDVDPEIFPGKSDYCGDNLKIFLRVLIKSKIMLNLRTVGVNFLTNRNNIRLQIIDDDPDIIDSIIELIKSRPSVSFLKLYLGRNVQYQRIFEDFLVDNYQINSLKYQPCIVPNVSAFDNLNFLHINMRSVDNYNYEEIEEFKENFVRLIESNGKLNSLHLLYFAPNVSDKIIRAIEYNEQLKIFGITGIEINENVVANMLETNNSINELIIEKFSKDVTPYLKILDSLRYNENVEILYLDDDMILGDEDESIILLHHLEDILDTNYFLLKISLIEKLLSMYDDERYYLEDAIEDSLMRIKDKLDRNNELNRNKRFINTKPISYPS